MDKQKALEALCAYIDAHSVDFIRIADEIWGYAELSLKEKRSAACYAEALEKAGFAVETGFCGIETAVCGSYGAGKPIIGILGEYDALSGLSQKGCCAEKQPEPGMTDGHGCGHNLLGAGAFAAACAVKACLEETGLPGTVIFYGCPGEEGGAAKAFFARENLWRGLDAALTWHPSDTNQAGSGSSMACIQSEYIFSGVASHAAGAPELGRSALDAVELMNTGVQYLREHAPRTSSIHYAITDTGGCSPNVVQSHASVLYMVRDAEVGSALKLQKRVDAIARGAAMMTETTLEKRFIDGCANPVPNRALEQLLQSKLEALGAPAYTPGELAFAEALHASYADTVSGLPGGSALEDEDIKAQIARWTDNGKRAVNDFIVPYHFSMTTQPGSTDVGDVSWQTPTAQVYTATQPSMCPGHSWQNVSVGKSGFAHRAMLHAAKAMAAAAMDLYTDPALLTAARTEFEMRTAAGYECPIPEGAEPVAL